MSKKSKVAIEDIKLLRAKTAAGVGLCKEALEATDGDRDKAVAYVNERSDVISRMYNETGAKIGLIKIAMEQAENDFEKAKQIIIDNGWAKGPVSDGVDKPKEGLIEAYVHGQEQKTVSLVEITCSTDFVARNEVLRDFAHEIALHVAAMNPKYVDRDSIPEDELESMKKLFAEEVKAEGKPENIVDKIVEGKLNKFYAENCLMEQKSIKDESKSIKNLVDETIGKVGEPIKIRRILCWKFGE